MIILGIFNGLLGGSSDSDFSPQEVEEQIDDILIPGESVDLAFQTFRSQLIFTSYRLIIIGRKGENKDRVSYKSVPYKGINRFSFEFQAEDYKDAELKLWCSGAYEPTYVFKFEKSPHISVINKAIAAYVICKDY